ncbi:hypothetical protein D9M72_580910 [compost metagenome]
MGDAAQEFEELRGPDDGIGNAGVPDQGFLGDLRAEVTALRQLVRADHGQRNVVADARGLLGGRQVAPGGLEKIEHRIVLERGRVGDIHDHLCAGQRLGRVRPALAPMAPRHRS